MGLASIDEVALCLRFMDLLRQDLLALGEGMAEASCCPLRLVVTDPPIELPFIPPAAGRPRAASEIAIKSGNYYINLFRGTFSAPFLICN